MRDYTFRLSDGREVPVAEMPTQEIHEALGGDMELGPGATISLQAGRERLQLELDIRRWGLRS